MANPQDDLRYAYGIGVNPRDVGVQVAFENDSVSVGGNTSDNTVMSYTIPAGLTKSLGGPGGWVWQIEVGALISNNTGSAANFTMRTKVNGTAATGTSAMSIPDGGTSERLVKWDCFLRGDNDYNLNQESRFTVGGLMTPPSSADIAFQRLGYTRGGSIVSATWDSDLVWSATAQWSAANQCDLHFYRVTRWTTSPG